MDIQRAIDGIKVLSNPKEKALKDKVDKICIGYSSYWHWQFFKHILKMPNVKNICIIGVYYGRDIGYIYNIAQKYGKEINITGVDKFNDKYCNDWDNDKRGMTWEQAGYGKAPDIEITKRNLKELNIDAKLIKSDAESFLISTNELYDMIYIDTSHDYESTKKLIELALLKIKDGGILSGDDYSNQNGWGVKKAVDELLPNHRIFSQWIWLAN